MTREVAKKIARGIADKIECNTADMDDWAEFWGFTVDEYEEFLDMAIKALEQQPCEDAISRETALAMSKYIGETPTHLNPYAEIEEVVRVKDIKELPPVTPMQKWIPISERLPEDLEPVNITWVNHEPEPYYHEIKDKNFVATAIHYRDQWYWYSTTCADYLGEYGNNEIDLVDDAVEIVAWMPLPEPYREVKEEV